MVGVPDNIHFRKRLKVIDKDKFDIVVISPTFFKFSDYEEARVFSINIEQYKNFRYFRLFYAYCKFIKKESFDIVYCFGGLSPIAWLSGLVSKKKLIVTTIGADVFIDEQLEVSSIIKANVKHLLRSADAVLSLSLFMDQRLLNDFKVPLNRIMRDYLAIEPVWYELEKCMKIPIDFINFSPIILSPRVLAPLYQQIEIIRALPLLKARFPKILLIQTGFNKDINYFEQCKAEVNQLGLHNNVLFLEPFEKHDDIIKFFDLSDVVIMIPKSDAVPTSMLEAWAREKPVILSNIDNYDECYNRQLYLKTAVDPVHIKNTIVELMEDRELKKNIVDNATRFFYERQKFVKNLNLLDQATVNYKRQVFSKLWGTCLLLLFLVEPWAMRFKHNFIKKAI